MNNPIFHILLLTALFSGTIFSYPQLEEKSRQAEAILIKRTNEALLFPDEKWLQGVAFGYKNFLANVLWFNTINYFGKHYSSDKNYRWLSHMCTVTFQLDSRARHIPEFCALMLAWEASDPEASIAFLDLAITAEPDFWRYHYLRGVTNVIFLNDTLEAKHDFQRGALTPEAPVFMTRLATKTLANLESADTAISFLKSMVARAKDPNERTALERLLRQAKHGNRITELEERMNNRKNETGKYPDSLESVLTKNENLADPYGGLYYWNDEAHEVQSSSGVPRGKILSKTFRAHTSGARISEVQTAEKNEDRSTSKASEQQ